MDYVFSFWLGVVVISTVGTLAHFFYDWTHQNKNKIIGLFAAVNESTWEHIKLALTPTFLWCLYDGYLFGSNPNYFLAKLASLLVLTIFIPLAFYSYRAFVGREILIIDIGIFYISIILSQLIFYILLTIPAQPFLVSFLSCIGLFIFFGCYMTLTLEPLKTFLFKDPVTGKYGFYAHRNLFKKHRHTKK